MTKREAFNGKPYAGNPHVRFDEGEVALAATPRRGSLLYKKLAMMIGVAAVAATGANAASVTIDSVTQRWPWNNKIDITYTVTDGQTLTSTGNDVYMRLVFNATIGGNSYTIDGVHDIGASASSGQHTVTWTPPEDLKVKASDCTMTATLYSADNPSGDDYMVVDLDTGVVSYEGLLYSQELSNDRYTNNAAYKTDKLVLRKVSRGGPYYTASKTWTTEYDFYAGIFPVTRAQYNKFDSSKTWVYSVNDDQTSGYKPADSLNYSTIRASTISPTTAIPVLESDTGTCFLQRLNYRTGNKFGFDLPTENMAEIARRAGVSGGTDSSDSVYFWGSGTSAEAAATASLYCAYKGYNEGTTSEVDAHLPNNWGIYDTAGNLAEWSLDDNSSGSLGDLTSAFTPRSDGGNSRVISNGYNYSDALWKCRVTYRSTQSPTSTQNWLSFRVYCIMK